MNRRTSGSALTDDGERASREMRVLAVTTHRPAEVVNSMVEMNAETAVVSVDNRQGLVSRNVETFTETRRTMVSFDPDIVFLDCYGLMGLVVTFLGNWYDVPVVARIVGDTWRIYGEEGMRKSLRSRDYLRAVRYQLNQLISSVVYSQVTGFAVVSEALKDVVHQHTGCARDRIGVVPVPITTDMDARGSAKASRERYGISEERVILTVTNLAFYGKYRGVRDILQELQAVLQQDSDLAIVIAGGNTYHKDLEAHLDAAFDDPDVRSRIYAPGFVESIEDLYALADLFVYVSYLDGYPNAVLEAQTARLPVVANAAYGMVEQITDGETGFLIDPSNPGELRDRVELLLTDSEKRHRLGNGGRERAIRENSPDAISQQLRAFLASILESERAD
jgi:glycosyltransferase involved in cell wall biosynthesis